MDGLCIHGIHSSTGRLHQLRVQETESPLYEARPTTHAGYDSYKQRSLYESGSTNNAKSVDRKGCLRLDEGQLAMLHVLRNGNFDEKKCQALMATCTSGNGAIQESHAMPGRLVEAPGLFLQPSANQGHNHS